MTSYSIHLTAPAVEPGLPVQEGGFSLLLPGTACANHFSTVQTHPSAGPCCLDPPQKAFHVFSCSVHFQVLKPRGFQGAYPSSPPQHMSYTPGDGQCPAAPCLGSWKLTGTVSSQSSQPPQHKDSLCLLWAGTSSPTWWESTKQRPTRQQCAPLLAVGAQTMTRVHPGRTSALPFPLHKWESQHELTPGTPVWVT